MIDKVIYIGATQGGRDGLVNLREIDPQCLGLFDIHLQLKLRGILKAVGPHAHDLVRILLYLCQQLIACAGQRLMPEVTLVNELKVKARGRAQLDNRREVKRKDQTVADFAEGFGGTLYDTADAVLFTRALLPWLKADKGHPGVLPLTTEAVAIDGQDGVNVRLLTVKVVISDLIQHLLRACLGCPGRQLHHGHKDALIFIRQK